MTRLAVTLRFSEEQQERIRSIVGLSPSIPLTGEIVADVVGKALADRQLIVRKCRDDREVFYVGPRMGRFITDARRLIEVTGWSRS